MKYLQIERRPLPGRWVDDILLEGPDNELCLTLGRDIDRKSLRRSVDVQESALSESGLTQGGSIALRLPPSLAYITNLLAAWRIGAQVALLDYRLTDHEVARALASISPQVLVEPSSPISNTLAGFVEITPTITPYPGGRGSTGCALIQLSSGSTGPSKAIGRSVDDLVAELDRYNLIQGFPTRGERSVVLASPLHVLGLVGGLLHSLDAGVPMTLPKSLTVDGVLAAIAQDDAPTTLLGVPSQAQLLTIAKDPKAPQLRRMITGGEPVSRDLRDRFRSTFGGAQLGAMYGMTEVGVIATDLDGGTAPELTPAPGIEIDVVDDEFVIAMQASPYIGAIDSTRWVDGWLHTRDAGSIDAATGRITVLGRRDSQVSIGGLKVDLGEVEKTMSEIPGVESVVVVYDGVIKAYVAGASSPGSREITAILKSKLARYKRPRAVYVLSYMPRTATGKPVRNPVVLRTAAEEVEVPT